jgi:hypothetical protein
MQTIRAIAANLQRLAMKAKVSAIVIAFDRYHIANIRGDRSASLRRTLYKYSVFGISILLIVVAKIVRAKKIKIRESDRVVSFRSEGGHLYVGLALCVVP